MKHEDSCFFFSYLCKKHGDVLFLLLQEKYEKKQTSVPLERFISADKAESARCLLTA